MNKNNKGLSDLPVSDDKEFWYDGHVEVSRKPKVEVKKEHYLVWDGPYAKCVSCSYLHTIPLDTRHYDIKDGQIIRKSKVRS